MPPSLGYCYIKGKDYPAALRALTRSSQLEPENGEAWNNLAAIHMHQGAWPQAFNALSGAGGGGCRGGTGALRGVEHEGVSWGAARRAAKELARRGLACHAPTRPATRPTRWPPSCPPAEAVKHKRDSWQTWENYGQVAARVGQWQTAVRALGQVLALSSGQRLDLATLAALVGQVEAARRSDVPPADGAQPGGQQEQQEQQQSDAAVAAEGAAPAADPAAASSEASGGLAELATALGELSTGGARADPADTAAQAEAQARADARGQAVLEQSVGSLLKQVAATASGDSAFWEVYARWVGRRGWGWA